MIYSIHNSNNTPFFYWVLILFVSVNSQYAYTQNHIEIEDVKQVIQLAQNQNPDLLIYQLNIQQANEELATDKGYYLPQISSSITGQINFDLPVTPFPEELGVLLGQPNESVNAQFGTRYNYNAGINISQTIIDWQSIQKIRLGKASVRTAQSQADAYNQNLIEQVSLSYFNTLISERALAITRTDLAIGDSILQISQTKFNQGIIDQFEFNQAKININNLKQSTSNTYMLWKQNQFQLKVLLGLSISDSIEMIGKIETIDIHDAIQLHADKELTTLQMQVYQNEITKKINTSSYLPKVSLYSYLGKQQFNDSETLSFENGSWFDYSYLGINLSIPIFSGFIRKNQVQTAKLGLEKAKQQLEIQSNISLSHDALLLQVFDESLKAMIAAKENYQLYDQNKDLALLKYEEGIISLENYFRVFDDYLNAENNYLNALSTLYSYYATILSRQ